MLCVLGAGKGVRIVEQRYALKEFLERAQRHMDSEDKRQVTVPKGQETDNCPQGTRDW